MVMDILAEEVFLQPQRLSSAAFEAMPAFAEAKVGSGSNVRCSDLLCLVFILAPSQNGVSNSMPRASKNRSN